MEPTQGIEPCPRPYQGRVLPLAPQRQSYPPRPSSPPAATFGLGASIYRATMARPFGGSWSFHRESNPNHHVTKVGS